MVLACVKKVLRAIGRVVYWCCICILIVCILGVCFAAYKFMPVVEKYLSEAEELVANSSASTFYTENTGYIYAADGTEIAVLRANGYSNYLESKDIPDNVKNAFVAIEDKRFYKHHGVDWGSTAASALKLVIYKHTDRGGSTITQQLVRNVFTDDIGFEKTYTRKLKEIMTAICLEKKYSKDLILEYYINNINFANNYYGIEAASLGYFDKPVSELTTSEIALLCAIPNNPSYYNPREHLDHTVKRRNVILKEMYNQGYLDRQNYLVALNSSVTLCKQESAFYNYESSFAIKCATECLMRNSGFIFRYSFKSQKEYDAYREEYDSAYSEASHLLYTGGYQVYTTLNLKAQEKAQKALDSQLKSFTGKNKDGVFTMQGAATVIDNKTGKVIACIGGREQETDVYSLNRAYQAYMQPGSTIKPLIVYTPALQAGYTPSSIVSDTEIKNGPSNSDGKYLGEITLREAVEKSRNCVAWRLLDELGPKVGLSYVQNMKFDKITPNDYYDSAALGGLYYGVTTVQMASGYATLENGGVFRNPDCIAMILNAKGKNVYVEEKEHRVYSEQASSQMIDVLQGVAKQGTAAGLVVKGNEKMPIACKTGTTNGGKCAWLCGITPYYSVAVYVGRDDGKATKGLWGSTYPKYVWQGIQSSLCKGKPVKKLYKIKEPKKKQVKNENAEASSETVLDSGGGQGQSWSNRVSEPVQKPQSSTGSEVSPPSNEKPSSKKPSSQGPQKQEQQTKPIKPTKQTKPTDTQEPVEGKPTEVEDTEESEMPSGPDEPTSEIPAQQEETSQSEESDDTTASPEP